MTGGRYKVVLQMLGLLLLGFGATMVPPIGVSLLYRDGEALHFFYSLLLSTGLGLACWLPVRKAERTLRVRDGFVVVGLFWVVMSTVSAVPFIFSPHLSLEGALFESVSGFTTTGATLIVGLDALPESILYYRQQLQWVGGMGIVVAAVAIMPVLGVGGMQLFRAETPGPMKDEKLTPRIKQTAAHLYTLYIGLTVACAVAYRLAGMSWFDAVGHAYTTLSTGGFSTHDASLGYFDSPAVEGIAVVFMMLGAISFVVHFKCIARRDLRIYLRDEEVGAFLITVAVTAAVLCALLIGYRVYQSPGEGVRKAVFQAVSVITSTGFTTTNFSRWPSFAPVLMIFVSFVGGCAGSTAGGMKVIRWLLLYKQGSREVHLLVHPKAAVAIKINGERLSERAVSAIWGFFSLYVLTFGLLMVLMMWTGADQVTAFSAVATCMNNLGPGLGSVAENFVTLNNAGLAVAAVAMLLGRLEIFTLLVLVSPVFWKQ